MSVTPVWRPLRDQEVSPWRMMKTRGVVIVLSCLDWVGKGGKVSEDGGDEMVVIVRGRPARAVLTYLFRAHAPVVLVRCHGLYTVGLRSENTTLNSLTEELRKP